jgi:hypothetical protein
VNEHITRFAERTGDVELGRKVMPDLIRLASERGAIVTDVIDAAADVSNELGAVRDRGRAILEIMESTLSHPSGRVSHREVEELAAQMSHARLLTVSAP